MAAKIIKVLIPVGVIAIAIVAASSLTSMRKPPEKKEEQRQAILVTAQPVEQQDLVYRIESQGTVKPRLETSLVSEVNGRIVEVADNFVEGGFFNAGDLLVRVEQADYLTNVKAAEASLANAQSALEEEKARGKVAAEEWSSFSAGKAPELGLRRPQLAQELANVRSAEAELENARRNLDYTQLKAPFDALVTRRLVERFATVAAGTPLLRVQNITELRVHINVPEQIMRQVRDTSDYLVSVRLSEAASERYPLAYREHATEVDPLTQTYQVSFAMPRLPDVNLLPGMTVNVVTEKVATNSTVLIPVSALDTATPEQFYVWRYQPETQTVQRIAVQVGTVREQQIEVLSGLNRGEQVVSAGIYQLQPGQQVQPFVAY